MHTGNLEKFIDRLNKLISLLMERRNSVEVQSRINQFYYMQKVTELKLLEESVNEAKKRLKFFEEKFETEYKQVYCRWRKDVRWMSKDPKFSKRSPMDKVQDSPLGSYGQKFSESNDFYGQDFPVRGDH